MSNAYRGLGLPKFTLSELKDRVQKARCLVSVNDIERRKRRLLRITGRTENDRFDALDILDVYALEAETRREHRVPCLPAMASLIALMTPRSVARAVMRRFPTFTRRRYENVSRGEDFMHALINYAMRRRYRNREQAKVLVDKLFPIYEAARNG